MRSARPRGEGLSPRDAWALMLGQDSLEGEEYFVTAFA
jgi:hypothetical protein